MPALEPAIAVTGASAGFPLDTRMAAARALDTARSSSASVELFGSFLLDGAEYALPAATLREVVNYPARVTPVPLSPPFLDGVFNLRGQVIPVLNLARIFQPQAGPAEASHKVAIVEHDNILVGIVFHCTGEVLRVRPEQRSVISQREGAPCGVVAGTILLDDGARLLQVLDARALVCIENVPQVQALRAGPRAAEKTSFQRLAERRQCIGFQVGGTAFGIEMSAIREIINVPEIKPSVMNGRLCLGRMDFRGMPVAVVDFAALLQFAPVAQQAEGAEQSSRRVLVARIGECLVGLLVDSVDTIFNFFEDEILPIPLLSRARAGMFGGCVSQNGKDFLFLDHRFIFSQCELLEIGAGHVSLYQDACGAAGRAKARSAREAWIAFTLDGGWAVPIGQVREIIPFRAGLVCPPGLPACVRGILNLRGQVVTVIDLRRLFCLAPAAEGCAARILVVEDGDERYGLIVDAVDNIVHVGAGARRGSARMLCGGEHGPGTPAEVLEVDGSEGRAATLNVFDRAAFLALLAQAMTPA